MYSFQFSDLAITQIGRITFPPAKDAIKNKLKDLSSNPQILARKTNRPILGSYYVKAGGKYSITFEIDAQNQTIQIIGVFRQQYLYRMMTGKVAIPITYS